MESFQTEEQQVEAIKSFWKTYGNWVITAVIVGFTSFIGVNLYKDSKLADETAVTNSFIELQESTADAPEKYLEQAETFIAQNEQASFAALTALDLAKLAVNESDWAAAEKHLTTAVAKAPDVGIKAIASLRLARVQIQTEQLEKALTTLSAEFPKAFLPNVEALKGDAYLKQGKTDLARAAYQTAIDNQTVTDPNLKMKLDDLAQVTKL